MIELMFQARRVGRTGSMRDEVADELRRSILAHKLPPGTPLPNMQVLCEQLGVSRTTVREALQELQVEGLVEVCNGRGIYVRTPNWEVLARRFSAYLTHEENLLPDILGIRAPLEVNAAECAALHAQPHHLAEMEQALAGMAQAVEDNRRFIPFDMAFHEAVYAASGNQVLPRLMRLFRGLVRAIHTSLEDEQISLAVALRDHIAVFESIRDRDPGRAAAAMAEHMRGVEEEQLRIRALRVQRMEEKGGP